MCAPLEEPDLAAAAELVRARQAAFAAGGPNLPEQAAPDLVEQLRWLGQQGPLVGAFDGGSLAGFLGGFPLDGRGRMFVPDWAWAAGERDAIEELYAHAAREWVAAGRRAHYWRVLASDEATRVVLSWLGFGMCGVDAARTVAPVAAVAEASVAVRRAGPNDVAVVQRFEQGLREHLAGSPVFHPLGARMTNDEQLRTLNDVAAATLLAESPGRPRAMLRVGECSNQAPLPLRSPRLASISLAFTTPDDRQRGAATALLAEAARWAEARGCTHLGVDFESANVVARRFWLSHFAPVSYTLCRQVEEPGAAP